MVVKINVRYFASVREQLGAGEQIVLSGVRPPATVGELRAWLITRSPAHALVLDPTRGLRTAFNQTLCGPDHLLEDGAEVAFFPPVTGG